MPPVQRAALVGGVSAVTAAGTVVGIEIGKGIVNNANLSESIKKSKHSDLNVDRVPSPDDTMINCPLEANDDTSPLEILLYGLYTLNILELLLAIILLLLLINRYIYKINIDFISQFINKYMPNKIIIWYSKFYKNSIGFSNKFTTIMFIVTSFIFLIIKIGNIYVSAELCNKIDDYVLVYDHFKNINKSSILLFLGGYNILFIKNKLYVYKRLIFNLRFYHYIILLTPFTTIFSVNFSYYI